MRGWVIVISLLLLSGCASAEKRQKQVDFYYKMGKAYLMDGDNQNGLVEFRSALKIDPKSTKVLYATAHAYYAIGAYSEAQAAIETALKSNPENGEARNFLGVIHETRGDQEAAIKAFMTAAALPNYRTPHYPLYHLGRIYMAQGDNQRAEEAFISTIKRVPEYYPARGDLASLYLEQERWDDAAEQLRVYLDLDTTNTEAHYHLARAYVGQNKPIKARAQLSAFLAQAGPEHPLLPDARALLDALEVE